MDEPESTLIAKVQDERNSEALLQLVDMHSGLYLTIINKYAHTYPNVIKADDLSDDRLFNIYRFILAYQDDQGTKLGSYIGQRTDYMCKTLLRKGKHDPLSCGVALTPFSPTGDALSSTAYSPPATFSYSPVDQSSIDSLTTAQGNSVSLVDESYNGKPAEVANDELALEEVLAMAGTLSVCPDQRLPLILSLRKDDLSWREIGRRLGLSHEMARKVYLRGIRLIREQMNEVQTPVATNQSIPL